MGKIKKLERELELLKEIYNLYYEIDQIQKKSLERFYPTYPTYPTHPTTPTNPWQPIRWTTHTDTVNIDPQEIRDKVKGYTSG